MKFVVKLVAHDGQVTSYGDIKWTLTQVMLPYGAKSLPKPKLTNHLWVFEVFTSRKFHQKMLRISILDMSFMSLIYDYSLISRGQWRDFKTLSPNTIKSYVLASCV